MMLLKGPSPLACCLSECGQCSVVMVMKYLGVERLEPQGCCHRGWDLNPTQVTRRWQLGPQLGISLCLALRKGSGPHSPLVVPLHCSSGFWPPGTNWGLDDQSWAPPPPWPRHPPRTSRGFTEILQVDCKVLTLAAFISRLSWPPWKAWLLTVASFAFFFF